MCADGQPQAVAALPLGTELRCPLFLRSAHYLLHAIYILIRLYQYLANISTICRYKLTYIQNVSVPNRGLRIVSVSFAQLFFTSFRRICGSYLPAPCLFITMFSCCSLPQRNKIRPKSVNRYVKATSPHVWQWVYLGHFCFVWGKCVSANAVSKIFFVLDILVRTHRVYQYICQLSRLGRSSP